MAIERSMNPENEGGQQPQQERDEQDAQRRYEFEKMGLYRREEYHNFPERNHPEEIRHEAAKVRGFWFDQWFRRGESPYDFIVEQSIVLPGRYRIEQLTDSLPSGLYTPTKEEKEARLVSGKFQEPITEEFLQTEGLRSVEENGQRFWVLNGQKRYLYKDNLLELKFYHDMGYDTSLIRPVIYRAWEVSPDEAEKNREKLADEIGVQVTQAEAWSNLLKKVKEQDIFASDLDAYVDQEFTRLGKEIMRGWAYAEIFNAPPTREGLAKFGDKTIAALRAWREVAEGKAYATFGFKDPKEGNINNITYVEGKVPNPFAYPKNQKLLEMAAGYVQDRVDRECPPQKKDADGNNIPWEWDKNTVNANNKDNHTAALAGLLLVDHFDIDAHAALDVARKYGEKGIEERDLAFEIAFADSAKMIHPRTRRMNEFLGFTEENPDRSKRRPHPREAGSPISLRFLPNLGSHLLEEVTVDTLATSADKSKKNVSIRVTLDQISEGARDRDGNRIIFERDGKRYSRITKAKESGRVTNAEVYEFELRELSDRSLWDSVSIVASSGGERKQFGMDGFVERKASTKEDYTGQNRKPPEVFELVLGTNSLPYELPKGLLERYALTKIFKEFTRTDYDKMKQEYSDPHYLQGLSKGISLGLVLLSTQHQLSRDTQNDLEEFIRIALIANYVSATAKNESSKSKTGEKTEQQNQVGNIATNNFDNIKIGLLNAAFTSRYFITKSDRDGVLSWGRAKDEMLFNEICLRRNEAPLSPFDYRYFTTEQIAELNKLYQ